MPAWKFPAILLFGILVTFYFTGCRYNQTKTGESLVKLNFENNETVTYEEAISFYQKLADCYPEARLLNYGPTDVGKPLHLFVMDADRKFSPESAVKSGKAIILIMNGIHPGEPDGIDASLMFADDVLRNHNGMRQLLRNAVICIIPVYNVDGMLNRSMYHRTGEPNPRAAGHRGNARNLDLNRDFSKMDTRNAQSFAQLFRLWQPHVFLDTHATNGTDHPQVITLIHYHADDYPEPLRDFYLQRMTPFLYQQMEQQGYPMIPYVDYWNTTPKEGIQLYPQTPRYSTGFTGLFNTLSYMIENQIYASYPDRVRATYFFMKALAEFTNQHYAEIVNLTNHAHNHTAQQKEFVLKWVVDTTQFRMIRYRGYEGEIGISPVTGLPRFGFNRNKPYDTLIPYYERHVPEKTIQAPAYYILPQAWEPVAERLALCGVRLNRFIKDTLLEVNRYRIASVKTSPTLYNGHFFHSEVTIETFTETVQIWEGDYLIPMNQPGNRFIVQMLEPEAPDSYFRWNFFDPILEEREYYSSFGFEPNALKYLEEHPEFKEKWEHARKNDPALIGNHRAQLGFIYYNTEWFDNVTRKYPVMRVESPVALPVR